MIEDGHVQQVFSAAFAKVLHSLEFFDKERDGKLRPLECPQLVEPLSRNVFSSWASF